jgi:hypothetical protein
MSSGLLWNPPIPGTSGKKRGRPFGARDRVKRKTPNRAHLRKDAMEKANRRIPLAKVLGASKRPRDDEVMSDDTSDEEEEEHEPEQKKFKNDYSEEAELHKVPEVNREPCTILICGKSGAGKTTAINNMIPPPGIPGDPYDNRFIVTGTKHKHNLSDLVEDEDHILEGMSEEFIKLLTNHHKEHPKARTLLLFDDHVGLDFNFKASKGYKKLCAASRNFGITIIDSCQDIAEVPKILRRNAHWLLFGNNYEANNEMISDQLSFPDLPKPQFKRVLTKIAKERLYQWLVYDDKKQEWWLWQPEEVKGLGHGEDESSDEEEEDEDDPRNKISGDITKPAKESAEQIGTTRARQDASKSRK